MKYSLSACMLVIFLSIPPAYSDTGMPIRIILNDWSSQLVMSYITAELLTKAGYRIEFVHVSSKQQWDVFRQDRADVQVEVWQGTMAADYELSLKNGDIIPLGEHGVKTREDWWYPIHLEQICPGLPDWRALQACWSVFIHPDTAPLGRYLGGPWENPDGARIRALKMKFQVIRVAADELWSELDIAIKENSPLVMFNWTPNWVEAVHKGRFIEFPKWEVTCETKPEWGENSLLLYDCGNPAGGWLKKAGNHRMKQRTPCALAVLKKISFNNSQLAQFSAEVVRNGKTEQSAARTWIAENEVIWQPWLDTNCTLR